MAKKEYVSIDIGYGFVKAISSNGKRALFPSIVGTGRDRGLANFLKREENKLDLSELHIKINGKHYYVGDMADKNSSDGSRVFERERFNHDYTKVLLNVGIQLVASEDTKEVVLFTGLPLEYYKSQVKPFEMSLLEETPEIEWVSGLPSGKRKVKVTQAKVFPQGMSAIWATLINHEGKFLKPELMSEGNQIAVIDIGFRTTDVCVVEMKEGGGFLPLLPLSDTIDQGVVNLNDNIKRAYQDKTGGSDLSESKINKIIKNQFITYKGKRIELANEVGESHQAVANSVSDRISKLWKDESDTFEQIFVVGGGGSLFTKYLQPNFDNRLLNIVDSQYANAIGYYRIGKMLIGDTQPEKIAN
ncbi:ParM/StbA family protein [Ornithinibacillus contaminans]|uniref:ParM/StbA family protein n=1 Tax=Ornithinibacillus contaminans TaxID=694055 RepID=UPI00064E07C6|nr:ParM/StbA family protein [Ornithinibacillus contaminans]